LQRQSAGYALQILRFKTAYAFFQAALIQGAYLLKQDDGIPGQTTVVGVYLDVGGQIGLVFLCCYGRGDYGGTEFVAHVILHN